MQKYLFICCFLSLMLNAAQSPRKVGCIQTSAEELILDGMRSAISIGKIDLLELFTPGSVTLSDHQYKSFIDEIEARKEIDQKSFKEALNRVRAVN